MAYVPVPKDLKKVKNKVIFNLTRRQLICFTLAGGIGVPIYLFSKSYVSSDLAAIFMVITMLPLFFIGMYERDGLPAEKIIYHIIRQKIILKKIRPYKTKNFYSTLIYQSKIDREIQQLEQKNERFNKGRTKKAVGIKKSKNISK